MESADAKLSIISKIILDIWNSQKNVVLCDHFIKNDQKFCIEILLIKTENSIIARYDEYDEKFEDAIDLYLHANRHEFHRLDDAINFILQFINISDLYQLFESNYSRRVKKEKKK